MSLIKLVSYFFFDNKFLLKNIPGGVIKLFIFKKGGEKVFEKKLFYPGLDTK